MQNEPSTLSELVQKRRENDLPTHVHVVGDFEADPPVGKATAHRVAELLVDENGTIRTDRYQDLTDGDVGFATIDEPVEECPELRDELRNLAASARVRCLAGIVVFAEKVPRDAERHLDARVRATAGGVERVERLQVSPYEYDVLEVKLDALFDRAQEAGSR